MGQTANLGCSFGTLHLCQSEGDGATAGVMPSRCGGAGSSNNTRRISKVYNFDLASASRFPSSSSFSCVFCATSRATEERRVVRVIPRRRCERERLLRELDLLRGSDHPNLARISDVLEDPLMLCVVMEEVAGESLLSAVAQTKSGQSLSERLVAHYARQLLLGLQHLHSIGVTHEDVHPGNILVTCDPPSPEPRLKLIDYGFAAKYGRCPVSPALQCTSCQAPEQVIDSTASRAMITDQSCDIWAVGVVTYMLLSGHWPFEAETTQGLKKKIRSGLWSFLPSKAWTGVSDSARAFVSSLLASQPHERPVASQALEEKFLDAGSMPKKMFTPLLQHEEVLRDIRRRGSDRTIKHAMVDALATCLSSSQLEEARRHLAAQGAEGGSGGNLTLRELRCCLVQAGVALPGRLLGTLTAVDRDAGDSGFRGSYRGEEVMEAAGERRVGLEEALLWSAWSAGLPDGASTVRREELPRLLDLGAPTLTQVFALHPARIAAAASGAPPGPHLQPGPAGSEASQGPLPEYVGFNELLAWLRSAGGATYPALASRWAPPGCRRVCAEELLVRMPQPSEPQ